MTNPYQVALPKFGDATTPNAAAPGQGVDLVRGPRPCSSQPPRPVLSLRHLGGEELRKQGEAAQGSQVRQRTSLSQRKGKAQTEGEVGGEGCPKFGTRSS